MFLIRSSEQAENAMDDAQQLIEVLRNDVHTLLAILTHHIEATGEDVDADDRAILDEIISDFTGVS